MDAADSSDSLEKDGVISGCHQCGQPEHVRSRCPLLVKSSSSRSQVMAAKPPLSAGALQLGERSRLRIRDVASINSSAAFSPTTPGPAENRSKDSRSNYKNEHYKNVEKERNSIKRKRSPSSRSPIKSIRSETGNRDSGNSEHLREENGRKKQRRRAPSCSSVSFVTGSKKTVTQRGKSGILTEKSRSRPHKDGGNPGWSRVVRSSLSRGIPGGKRQGAPAPSRRRASSRLTPSRSPSRLRQWSPQRKLSSRDRTPSSVVSPALANADHLGQPAFELIEPSLGDIAAEDPAVAAVPKIAGISAIVGGSTGTCQPRSERPNLTVNEGNVSEESQRRMQISQAWLEKGAQKIGTCQGLT